MISLFCGKHNFLNFTSFFILELNIKKSDEEFHENSSSLFRFENLVSKYPILNKEDNGLIVELLQCDKIPLIYLLNFQ